MSDTDFLALAARSAKPRTAGLTHVLDPGIGPAAVGDVLAGASRSIDIWKVGWGTAYVDAALGDKIALLAEAGVDLCLGGTLLEIAWAQGRAEECLAWARERGFARVEVSRGTVAMTLAEKGALIARAARDFSVLAEVGSKAPGERHAAQCWPAECRADLDAGAALVVTEGRQSGTVGTYDEQGRVRPDVVEAVAAAVGVERVVFEAPRASQQAWFVRRFGPEVNLGNVAPGEVLSVETLRLGLRSDTASLSTSRGVLNDSALLRDAKAAPSPRWRNGPIQQRYRAVPVTRPVEADDTTWTPLATGGVVQDPPSTAGAEPA